MILSSCLMGCALWLVGEGYLKHMDGSYGGVVIDMEGYWQKCMFVSEAGVGAIGTHPLNVTDVRTKAQAEADALALRLKIYMWVLNDLYEAP